MEYICLVVAVALAIVIVSLYGPYFMVSRVTPRTEKMRKKWAASLRIESIM